MKRTLIAGTAFAILLSVCGLSHAVVDRCTVISVKGRAQVTMPGDVARRDVEEGMPLPEGARLLTGESSYIELALNADASNRALVGENADCVIKIDSMTGIELIDGKIFTALNDMDRRDTFIVRTPSAVCGARGTGWVTEVLGDSTLAVSFDGRVFARGINPDGSVMDEKYWIKRGFARRIERFSAPGSLQRVRRGRINQLRGMMGMPPQDPDDRYDRGRRGTRDREKGIRGREDRRDRRRLRDLRDGKNDQKNGYNGGGEDIPPPTIGDPGPYY